MVGASRYLRIPSIRSRLSRALPSSRSRRTTRIVIHTGLPRGIPSHEYPGMVCHGISIARVVRNRTTGYHRFYIGGSCQYSLYYALLFFAGNTAFGGSREGIAHRMDQVVWSGLSRSPNRNQGVKMTTIRCMLPNMDDQTIIGYYHQTRQIVKTAKDLHIDHKQVKRVLLSHGINLYRKRRYTLDEQFFDVIDTEAKAYFLGLLWADGNNSGQGSFSLKLSVRDRDIVERFREELKSSRPIYEIRNIYCTDRYGVKHVCRDAVNLVISSRYMVSRLESVGLIPNKTSTLRFPSSDVVPLNLMHHFVRGYFDGDGTVSAHIPKDRKLTVFTVEMVMKNKALADDLVKTLNQVGIDHLSLRKAGTVYKISIFSGSVRIKFMQWLYKEANIYLTRKREKFDQLFTRYQEYLNRRTTKHQGISLENGVYIVRKSQNGRIHHLGRFRTEQDAVKNLKEYTNANPK